MDAIISNDAVSDWQGKPVLSVAGEISSQKRQNEPESEALSKVLESAKHKYSGKLHTKIVGGTLTDIVKNLHLPLEDINSLDDVLKADYISIDDKLRVYSAYSDIPFLYDATACTMENDVYSNVALHNLLVELNCCISIIEGALCVIVGSISGFEYVTNNRQNRFCLINQYFKHRDEQKHLLAASELHVKDILALKPQNNTQQVYDLSNHESLYTFFEKALVEDTFRLRCVIDTGLNKVVEIRHFFGNLTDLTSATILTLDNICYTIQTMSDVSDKAIENGYPFVHLRMNGKCDIAYRTSKLTLPNAKIIIEIELFPRIDDANIKPPPLVLKNITALLTNVRKQVLKRTPMIVHLESDVCASQRLHRIILDLVENPMNITCIINQSQVFYEGSLLFDMKLTNENIPSLTHINNICVIFGELRNSDDIKKFETLVDNLIPTIAFCKSGQLSLPSNLTKFGHIVG
ncbi:MULTISPECIES: hypothetical protein [Vibrio]|uniref:hypothetical protein n=1 Tax=Vibrio TaxID=662 RepID=UPI0004DEFE83|nr:hypothetical protein [Vibrio parahaemolyticus]HAS6026434.1 hypothetical protein [Vibrio vulnificus]HAS6035807.1 hypothetical protein [Vibrio vulnificus]HDY7488568.1 hypothetical protein [Vibrio vulnificus]HDY7951697.1 hypothetical protein [Vibrio vulnificus]HDY8192175.1 hypothetical protein [Vibrio vulnificus]